MSEQTPNPERVRRRRSQNRIQVSDSVSSLSRAARENTPPAPEEAHASAAVSPPVKKTSPRKKKKRTLRKRFRLFWRRIPLVLRVIIAALCILLFLTATISITRSYLAQQEERRRLEAEAAERAQHPFVYADHITYYAQLQGLDPALVSAIILSESSFNPEAVSYLNARGLMQLMPDTAGWIAHKLDEDDETYTFDKLFDPEVNIRYGTWYLGYLSRRFDGDPVKIICAYHAGQGNVDAWLANPKYSRDGVTLDIIPMENTATYVSRVLKARDVYRKYYFPLPEQQASPSEGESQHAS